MSSSPEKGLFHAAAKVFLRNGPKLLLLHDIFGDWDLPGGRILPHEFGGDIKDVIARKMQEEVGPEVHYQLGRPETVFQVTRTEATSGQTALIFGIGYSAVYLGGRIQLGPHHDDYLWANVASLQPDEYFRQGWEIGVTEYLKQHD